MRRFLVPLSAAVLVVAACGGEPAGTADVIVTMKDFSVTTNKPSFPAGKVTLLVRNSGSSAHDFWIIKSDAASGSLPQQEGKAVATALHKTGELNPGQRQRLELDLEPGKYILICNVATHYGLGMHMTFTVEGK